MKKIVKSIIMYMVVCTMVMSCVVQISAKTVLTKAQTESYLNTISWQLMSTYSNPKNGMAGGDWAVMSLARYGGITEEYIKIYKKNLTSTVKKCKGVLSERKYTEYSRVVIALTAIGEDPESFQGYNLIEPLYDLEKVKIQGINGVAYALIAINCGNYIDESKQDVMDKMVEEILKGQMSDGGWSLAGKKADIDLTAICVQALVPYMENKEVKDAVDSAIITLSNLQCDSGGFTTMGTETCESTAQVLVALTEAGIDIGDSRFIKNENTILDGLLAYYKDGCFSHGIGTSKNGVATEQAAYALVSYYRSISGMNRLYDMSDGLVYKDIGKKEPEVVTEESAKKQSVISNEQGNNTSNNIEKQTKTEKDKKSQKNDNKKNETVQKDDGENDNKTDSKSDKVNHSDKAEKKVDLSENEIESFGNGESVPGGEVSSGVQDAPNVDVTENEEKNNDIEKGTGANSNSDGLISSDIKDGYESLSDANAQGEVSDDRLDSSSDKKTDDKLVKWAVVVIVTVLVIVGVGGAIILRKKYNIGIIKG